VIKKDECIDFVTRKTQTIRRFFPAIAFFSGFTWDSVTMGRMVKTVDLAILGCYYLGAVLVLIFQSKDIGPKWQRWLTLILQFFFGGLFSALVVFYFKSSSAGLGTLFVLGLGFMLVANEFLGRKYEQQTLTWTIFTLCGVMFLNFLIPHIVHSIHSIWFYLSCFLSLAIVYTIRRFAGAERHYISLPKGKRIYYRKDITQMIFPVAIVVVLIVLHQKQIIPPVPLVLKENFICVNLEKAGDSYQCQAEKQPFYRSLGIGTQTIHFKPNQKIYNLTSIYAPNHVKVEMEQRWFILGHDEKSWLPRGTVPTPMTGGRKNGWRVYSFINKTVAPGRWKVETALIGGAVLANEVFILQEDDGDDISYEEVVVR
jgi:hypothetical protein